MWIRSVRAHPFGPIKDDTIDLGPGLTVVAGDNESGKSSWHTAVTTALTGRRKGRPRKVDRAFADRYQPWDHDGWAVSCVVALADGRSIRLVHDLARTTSQAFDDATGADITAELANEGGVDIARLVGLNRDTLPLVASVRQAEVLALAAASANDDALGALRGFLQQSISSRSDSDTTAEVALDRLATFRKSAIGTTKAGSLKPLRQALEAVTVAEQQVQQSVSGWNEHKQGQVELARLESDANDLTADVMRRRAAVAQGALLQAEAELVEARRLRLASSADGAEPAPPQRIDTVRRALTAFEQLPATPDVPSGSDGGAGGVDQVDIATLQAELAALPSAPSGDLEPRPKVLASADALRQAGARLDAHDDLQPTQSSGSHEQAGGDLDPDQLRELAHELERPGVHEPVDERRRVSELEARAGSASPQWAFGLAIGIGLVALVIAAVAVTGGLGLGTAGALILAAVGVAALGFGARLWSARPSPLVLAELVQARYALGQAEQAFAAGGEHREVLLAGLVARSLPTEGRALRRIASERERDVDLAAAATLWQDQRVGLVDAVNDRTNALANALAGTADVSTGGPAQNRMTLLAQVDGYVAACTERRTIAAQAARRDGLQARIDARQEIDGQRDAVRGQRDAVIGNLLAEAELIGMADLNLDSSAAIGDVSRVAGAVGDWLSEQATLDDQHRSAARAAARLSGLLADRSIDDLMLAVETTRSDRDRLVAAAAIDVEEVTASDDGGAALQRAESKLAVLSDRMSELRGRLVAVESRIGDMAEVREAHARAVDEHQRLERLGSLVGEADRFLRSARDAVHRDIAPSIAEATKHHLATVSGGRYKELRVNPDDLSVQVQLADGSWRLADRLSHGTAEQIYLLVRAAIAEIVAPDAESCPLILDDVTVHADEERTTAMLEVLAELALSRQVVMFSQELSVRTWAEQTGADVVLLPTP